MFNKEWESNDWRGLNHGDCSPTMTVSFFTRDVLALLATSLNWPCTDKYRDIDTLCGHFMLSYGTHTLWLTHHSNKVHCLYGVYCLVQQTPLTNTPRLRSICPPPFFLLFSVDLCRYTYSLSKMVQVSNRRTQTGSILRWLYIAAAAAVVVTAVGAADGARPNPLHTCTSSQKRLEPSHPSVSQVQVGLAPTVNGPGEHRVHCCSPHWQPDRGECTEPGRSLNLWMSGCLGSAAPPTYVCSGMERWI